MPRCDVGKRLRKIPHAEYMEKLRKQITAGCLVDSETGCWIWQRAHQKNGYGTAHLYGRSTPAHRVAYKAFIGEITLGLEVCHKCDVRDCVNPAHLYLATHAENMRDLGRKGRGRNGYMSGAFVPTRDEQGKFNGKANPNGKETV